MTGLPASVALLRDRSGTLELVASEEHGDVPSPSPHQFSDVGGVSAQRRHRFGSQWPRSLNRRPHLQCSGRHLM
jgi:hypothetical protein